MDHTDYKWTIGGRISRFLSRWGEWPVVEAVRAVNPDAKITNPWTSGRHWLCAYCRELNTTSWLEKICTEIHCGHCHGVNTVVLKGGRR
ncbi:hypothetical protein LCGC14_0318240 [marine sediment metagenome]|uniref:Uncharacterized protein n=1 Tax=marine sediment metagenome TaxID=412755 RepID=A0A0F9TK08_9ZZZZ